MLTSEIYILTIASIGVLLIALSLVSWQIKRINRTTLGKSLHFEKKITWIQYGLYMLYFTLTAFGVNVFQTEHKRKTDIINTYTASISKTDLNAIWQASDINTIPNEFPNKKEIEYGRNLISNTSDYLGPEGFVKKMSNGMNCQNCHLAAGTKPFGNNYSAVAATYPKFRARSGAQETIIKRINDCFQRSLNGEALDSTSREMRAIVAYINWLGEGVPKGKSPKGVGLVKLPFLNRAASPEKGQLVYTAKCVSCHATDGNGLPMPEGNSRRYPPLWGERSYNEAAGLFRISNLAGYVKANMPFGASYDNPQLSDEEAWDVAAFINAQPHPKHKFLAQDFPDISKKPFDHPFGPFKDTFSVAQHQFGPFQAVVDFYKK